MIRQGILWKIEGRAGRLIVPAYRETWSFVLVGGAGAVHLLVRVYAPITFCTTPV